MLGAAPTYHHSSKKDLHMYPLSSLRQRVSRVAVVFLLLAVVVLGMATIAAANSPDVLPVEPDGGIGN